MIVYELPLPPSVNAMFVNRGTKGAFRSPRTPEQRKRGRMKAETYFQWKMNADRFLKTQLPLRTIQGPVSVCITISENANGDLDNRCKAILDYLVHHKIIEGDSKQFVRSIYLTWGEVDGARVEIARPDNSEWLPRKVQNRSVA